MNGLITLFLCGDVMTGRGIDLILPHPSAPPPRRGLWENGRDYAALAEARSGPIPRPVDYAYIWGMALAELERARPGARIINLETSVTRSTEWSPFTIGYRMDPGNIPCLSAARIDCCVLGNNHARDFGPTGLVETLASLAAAGLRTAGAGRTDEEAAAPAVLDLACARVLVFSAAFASSGVLPSWAARRDEAGVSFAARPDADALGRWVERVARHRRPGDLVVASLHWGGNWGYGVAPEEAGFARALIDRAGVDVVHGHSSHHPKAVEVHRGKLILYGCGDLINDYEGIPSHRQYRDDLGLLYLASLDPGSGRLARLELVPTRLKRFRLERPPAADAAWIRGVLARESRRFGTVFRAEPSGLLVCEPARPDPTAHPGFEGRPDAARRG